MKIVIDWASINSEEDFYSAFLPQVKAPDWHGHNLDALNDSVVTGDINGINPPYKITNINISKTPESMANFQRKVIGIFNESAIEYLGSEITIK